MADINQGLHPKLSEILAIPDNPDAVPVEIQSPEQARAEWKADMAAVDGPAPQMDQVSDLTLPGAAGPLPARMYVPAGMTAAARPCLVYFHGGGFIRGDLDTHDSICRVLASAAQVVVISVAYRLAPETRCPGPVLDAMAAARHVAAHADALGLDRGRLAVGGDSAGGNIAAALTLIARDTGAPDIRAQLLIYPVADLATRTRSAQLFSKGYLLNSMPFYAASYLGPTGDASSPMASPLLAPDHGGLPPAVILTAGFDPLRDEGIAYADRLRDAGCAVTHLHHPDMIHGFVSLRGLLKEADEALHAAAKALARVL